MALVASGSTAGAAAMVGAEDAHHGAGLRRFDLTIPAAVSASQAEQMAVASDIAEKAAALQWGMLLNVTSRTLWVVTTTVCSVAIVAALGVAVVIWSLMYLADNASTL